jgi:hypothetical protein
MDASVFDDFGAYLAERFISTLRRQPTEKVLQDAIAASFTEAKIRFEREAILSRGDRIDFVVFGAAGEEVGIEVKIDGSLAEVTRQLHRYAQHERLTSLILVTTRATHRGAPREFNGKTIHVLHLLGGAF